MNDHASPSTIRSRESNLKTDEAFIDVIHGKDAGPWATHTFTEYFKRYISALPRICEGNLSKKIKGGTLSQVKKDIKWWAMRKVPEFTTIATLWDVYVTEHIYMVALAHSLEFSSREKNNLGDAELSMLFRQIQTLHTGFQNWQQHFIAWVTTYITSARPSTLAVGRGYEKGSSLGLPLQPHRVRTKDETLRWRDVQWLRTGRTGRGIGLRIHFRYMKGHRHAYDPYARDGIQVFTFFPTVGDSLEFDVTLILTGLALARGLFRHLSMKDVVAPNGAIDINLVVNDQPILCAADTKGNLIPDTGLRSSYIKENSKNFAGA